MNHRLALVLAATSLLGLSACKDDKKSEGGGGGGGKVASCNMPSMGACTEYRGGNLALGTESLAKLCMPEISESAKFSETACPTEKLVATCAKNEGKEFFYESYPIELARTETMCTERDGKWTAVK